MLRGLRITPSVVLLAFGSSFVAGRSADATTPIDYTQRNTSFTPGGTVTPTRQTPAERVAPQQERRVEKTSVEKTAAPLAGREASIEVTEAREKPVREKDSRRPETQEHKTSAFDAKTGPVSTRGQTATPPLVAKYNDSMIAASAANMALFPAVDRSTTAKLNRFVFRKNPAEPSTVTEGARVVPAAGGTSLSK